MSHPAPLFCIDPLDPLQIGLMLRYRAGQADEPARRGIHISIKMIAAGLRYSGNG